jgi:hypothetical protein
MPIELPLWTPQLQARIRHSMETTTFPLLFRPGERNNIDFQPDERGFKSHTGQRVYWKFVPASYERLRAAHRERGDNGVHEVCVAEGTCYALQVVLQHLGLAPKAVVVHDASAWRARRQAGEDVLRTMFGSEPA